ncbi:MAG: class I SAM-dependent methyltransferase [Burkholderiales bacterium]|nr:class I SAM-dependent methyltransferase [Burkholderiales bacterium]
MTTTTTVRTVAWPPGIPPAARAALKLLAQLRHGTLTLHLPDGSAQRFGEGEPHAALHLASWQPFTRALRSGDIGFAESYVDGEWSTPSLPDLLRLVLRNREALEAGIHGHWWGRLAYRLRHLLHRNTRAGSRRNIHAHYDLGNAFYALWLDPSMNYSAACFDGQPGQDLEQAQRVKMRRALQSAQVGPGTRVLEIGCGWGAVAELAAGEFGAHVTGVTLSTEQLAWARERLQRAGLAPQADLRLQDYRDIADGPYDAIVSIEMLEAVGREWWPTYFRSLRRLLKPGGRACIQTIEMADDLWPRYIRSTDFIQQYVFPGGCLPCPAEFRRQAEAAGLRIVASHAFGADYAETLRRWRERFLARRAEVLALGFDERFIRLWEFYLGYCEAAFAAGSTDVVQYTLQPA